MERRYRCPACNDRGSGPLAEADLIALEQIEGRGLAYWYLADRVAPTSSRHRRTVQRLLDLYTPRNLYVLAQVLIKMEALFADSSQAEAMRGALLRCLDVGSALFAADAPEVRPRQLRLPLRYLERNIWECFGQACERLAHHKVTMHLEPELDSFLEARGNESEGLVYLQVGTLRALADQMDSTRLPLILAMPPRLDPLFWSLSYLWSGWLYGPRMAEALESLLGRQSHDWGWYQQSLEGAFHQAAKLLRPEGHLLLLGRMTGSDHEAALLLAASGAGFALDHALSDGEGGVQLHFRRKPFRTVLMKEKEDLITRAASLAEEAVAELLRARGEPTPAPHLRMAAAGALARQGWLSLLAASEEPLSSLEGLWEALEDADTFLRFDDERWWLRDGGETASPLADRVEAVVYEILAGTLGIAHEALLRRVYERFPEPLTPQVTIVEACLRSYGEELAPGYWRLAADEEVKSREAQAAQVVLILRQLGQRMGYVVKGRQGSGEGGGYDITWGEGDQPVHGFVVRWRAQVATDIFHSNPETTARHQYIVLPQAREELVRAKLAHDPRLAGAMATGHWQFLKYAPLRTLAMAEEVARHALRQIVGLEPIIEQPEAQIPLF